MATLFPDTLATSTEKHAAATTSKNKIPLRDINKAVSYKGQDKLRNLGGLRSELAEKLELPFSRILRSQTTLVICSHLSGGRVEMGVGWGC